MQKRYLKSRRDGWIFDWDAILADNPSLYEVSEQEAYPERFIPEKQVEIVETAVKKRKRGSKLSLDTVEEVAEPDLTPIELAIEASRGWPK